MEWSVDFETPVFVHLTFLQLCWHFIGVDDVPCLTNLSVLVVDTDVSVFRIDISYDGHDLSFFVDKHVVLESEKLEPSSIGGSHVQVV